MKVFINMELTDSPYGGGNQFLKSLKNYFTQKDMITNSYLDADIILYNSHHNLELTLKIRNQFPYKLFFHRIDGPLQYRGKSGINTDKKIFLFSQAISDGQIFQSNWSLFETRKNYKIIKNHCVIQNSANENIFYRKKIIKKSSKKIKLIATSWSDNYDKGFDIYKQLDDNLDFSKYSMTFIGNSPITFNNIQIIKPMKSLELANKIRDHDIFIFASKKEACSNTLIEAISCGLPCIARNTSSNPEILNESGELFDNINDLIMKIEIISSNVEKYASKIKAKKMEEIGNEYSKFFYSTKKSFDKNQIRQKINLITYLKLKYFT